MSSSKLAARIVALGYLALLLVAPVAMIFYRTFEGGLAPVWKAITEPNAIHAFWLSLEIVAIAVPLNETITSSTCSADFCAGLPDSTEMIRAPDDGVRWSSCCRDGVTGPTVTPM